MSDKGAAAQQGRRQRRPRGSRPHRAKRGNANADSPLLFGQHAVMAALQNPRRTLRTLYAPAEAHERLRSLRQDVSIAPFSDDIANMLPPGAVHQRLVLDAAPLEQPALPALLASDPPDTLVMLDQVTDPHNVGAIIRSAAAFGAGAIIMQERNAPTQSGTLARAASGLLERIPWVSVTNLSRALEDLGAAQYWCVGLDGEADMSLEKAVLDQTRLCLVLGAEGSGLRQNVKRHCDCLARVDIAAHVESLNVSNAAAVGLYVASKRRKSQA